MAKALRISRGGQVSVPAAVRKRWATTRVLAEDHGDHVVLRPVPEDPIAAASGAFEAEIKAGPSASDAVREARIEDARATNLGGSGRGAAQRRPD